MLYNFLGGVQFKDNASEGRLKPFTHAFLGVARRKDGPRERAGCVSYMSCPGKYYDTGLAAAIGGGLDIHRDGNITMRAFQVDYNPVKYDGGFEHQMRVGVGVIF